MNALLACVSMHSVRTSSAHGGQPGASVPLEPAKEGCEGPCGWTVLTTAGPSLLPQKGDFKNPFNIYSLW